VVLVEPEIPHNTGSIGRTCVALGVELILIRPYGFSLDTKTVQRAGTRYWQFVDLSEYDTWQDFLAARQPERNKLFFFEEDGAQSFYAPDYPDDAYLVFGRESTGLSSEILSDMQDRLFHVPMTNDKVKSLNLSNVATAVIYQALRGHFT
jgi:tRNA (cytidine/uridine-2'-O-)-methyltransferase